MTEQQTIYRFSELLEYKFWTGDLVWRVSRGKARMGTIAGFANPNGYREIGIDGKNFKAHRVAWMMHNGPIPEGMYIDHINGFPGDNRMENLRLATQSQNLGNRRGTAGRKLPKGVVRSGSKKKPYKAAIMLNGRRYCLGYFGCPTGAHLAYVAAARRLFGEFARPA